MQFRQQTICLVVMLMSFAATARAEIIGFGNFSQFEINQNDAGPTPSISIANDRIRLTDSATFGEARSIFHTTPQTIAGPFTASFTYQTNPYTPSLSDGAGLAFVIQNSSAGPDALGFNLGGLGYAFMPNSLALSLELLDGGRSGMYLNGNKSSFGSLTSPLNLGLGNPVLVDISYDGSILRYSLTDSVTLDSYSDESLINIPNLVGGSTAYVGITASTGNAFPRDQFVSHLTFHVPEPGSIAMASTGAIGLLGIGMLRRRRHLASLSRSVTDGTSVPTDRS